MLTNKVKTALSYFSPLITNQIDSYNEVDDVCYIIIKKTIDVKLISHLLYATGEFDDDDNIKVMSLEQYRSF